MNEKTILVTITKEIEVDIPDDMLTEEHLEEFSSYMFPVDAASDGVDIAVLGEITHVDQLERYDWVF